MEFRVELHNNLVRITGGANNPVLEQYFTESYIDYSQGRNRPKTVETRLYKTSGDDMIVPRNLIRYKIGEDSITHDFSGENIFSKWSEDLVTDDEIRHILEGITLRDIQIDVIRSLMSSGSDAGAVQACTGFGKTLVIAGFIKLVDKVLAKDLTTVILVPTSHLLTETSERLESYGCKVNIYGETRKLKEGHVNVSMVTSMYNDLQSGKLDPSKVHLAVVDEAHHSGARTYYDLLIEFSNAEKIVGLSGTLFEKDLDEYDWNNFESFSIQEKRIVALFGKVAKEITYPDMVDAGYLTPIKYYQKKTSIEAKKSKDYNKIARLVIDSKSKQQEIVEGLKRITEMDYQRVLIFVRLRETGESLLRMIQDQLDINGILVYGGKSNGYLEGGELKWVGDNKLFPDFISGKYKVLISTTVLDEGVDVPAIDSMILGAGGKSIRQLLQRVGRGVRLQEGKDHALILDYADNKVEMTKNHALTRRKLAKRRLGTDVVLVKNYSEIS